MTPRRRLVLPLLLSALCLIGVLAPSTPAHAQNSLLPVRQPWEEDPEIPPDQQPPMGPPISHEIAATKFPPTRLGKRLEERSLKQRFIPTLVLVPDESSFLAAISAWRVDAEGVLFRFPILFDDGSYAAQQRIARFVRAFKPESVVRFKSADNPLPETAGDRRAVIETTLGDIWGAAGGKPQQLKERWDSLGYIPPGIVVAWPTDPVWSAGLALAAAHGQPIIWVEGRGDNLDGQVPLADAEQFNLAINTLVEPLGWEWGSSGDDIETITLCANMPVKTMTDGEVRPYDRFRATTDVIGRVYRTDKRQKISYRWAWCSQIAGDSGSALYDAMSALFLEWWHRAWLLDGYNSAAPWVHFDMTTAADFLARGGVPVALDDQADGVRFDQLRRRAAGFRAGSKQVPIGGRPGMGVDAGLIAFNTKGNTDFFELTPSLARPVDIPILRKPAAVYFVHSWSAWTPNNRATVAGMWRDRGAFAYIGSVDEPILVPNLTRELTLEEIRNKSASNFVPTPTFAQRIAGRVPWGALSRPDAPPWEPWKIAVFGDPLMVLGLLPARVDDRRPDLPHLADIAETLPASLKSRDFAAALRTLALLGRDLDAQRLISALLTSEPASVTPEVALAAIHSAFAMGDFESVIGCARVLRPVMNDPVRVERERIADVRDMVWHATWPVQNALTPEETDLLAHYLRPESLVRDADEAGRAVGRFEPSIGSRRDVIERARTLTKDETIRDELRRMIR